MFVCYEIRYSMEQDRKEKALFTNTHREQNDFCYGLLVTSNYLVSLDT